jgi:undecaprenyl-diphosphatase
MSTLQSVILAIIEGITEFLPISSTGHMIIAEAVMKLPNHEFTKLFTVNIQFGAILSVITIYFKKFFQSFDFYKKLFVAFIPAAVIGFLLNDFIDSLLSNVLIVGITLLLGGIILIYVDRWFKNANSTEEQKVSYANALIIGLFQTISMIPGVSRSAATIIGGLTQKLNRKNAAEFSFFLAVPTMFAATSYKLLKTYKDINHEDIFNLLVGNIVAYIVALIAIKSFISFLTKHGFQIFGYYRVILGLIIIILFYFGVLSNDFL